MRQNVVFALKVGLVALCFLNVIELAIFSEVTHELEMGLANGKLSLNVFKHFNGKFYLQRLY